MIAFECSYIHIYIFLYHLYITYISFISTTNKLALTIRNGDMCSFETQTFQTAFFRLILALLDEIQVANSYNNSLLGVVFSWTLGEGFGLTDGEGIERLFHLFSVFIVFS